MAENESLDLGGAYAKRWDVPFESIRKGASCKDAARKVEGALYSGLRKTLQQLLKDYGVSLQDLLTQRHSPHSLHQLIRKTRGHQYVEFFAAASAISGPSDGECLRGWVEAILDRVFDQISHRVNSVSRSTATPKAKSRRSSQSLTCTNWRCLPPRAWAFPFGIQMRNSAAFVRLASFVARQCTLRAFPSRITRTSTISWPRHFYSNRFRLNGSITSKHSSCK